ncbi:hypothetical protein GKQ38_03605 [Candidatus Nanohaloarchaea archaeon]|nr:hypothetical protein GKQ38_03605 [Candidatus Nanohaloarchaea archaeon]
MEVMGQEISEELQEQLKYVGISFAILVVLLAGHNLLAPDSDQKVGYTEIDVQCLGVNAGGFCLGMQKQTHTTYNYDNYTEVEPGTANFYRRVESELMMQAYNICDEKMNGMAWTDEASYRNRTATEWMQNENVTLLPCEKTFFRPLPEDTSS